MRDRTRENCDCLHRVGLLRCGSPDCGCLSRGGHGASAGKHGLWGRNSPARDRRPHLRSAARQTGAQLPFGRRGALVFPWVGPVRFSKQGVTLTLSDAALDGLDLMPDSVFYLRLFPTEGGFSLAVEVDGRAVSDLPGCQVMLPVTLEQEDAVPMLTDEDGVAAAETLDAERGIAVFPVRHTGRTVSEVLPNQPEVDAVSDTIPSAQPEELATAGEETEITVPVQPESSAVLMQPPDYRIRPPGSPPPPSDSAEPETPEQTPASRGPKELPEPSLHEQEKVLTAALFLLGGAVLAAFLWRRWRR